MWKCPDCQAEYLTDQACPLCRSELSEVEDPRVGSTLAGVLLEQRVSETRLASVYCGRRDEQQVAIKIYRSYALLQTSERAGRERATLSCLSHPNIAELVDSGTLDDGSVYLTSAWVQGQSLEQLLWQGPMAWHVIAPILAGVCNGLQALHGAGVVHRDLKPSNIMVPDSGQPRAVLLDFGHALMVDEVRLTDTGQILGSAAYMAPEQAAGRQLDARADLYALGVVLYRALTGSLPYTAASPVEVLRLHQTEPVIPPRARAPECKIPSAAEDLCLWLLAKPVTARVPNARVLAITLQAALRSAESAPSQAQVA